MCFKIFYRQVPVELIFPYVLIEAYKIQPLPTLRSLFIHATSFTASSFCKNRHFPSAYSVSTLTCMVDSSPSLCSHLRHPLLRETSLLTLVNVPPIHKSLLMVVIKDIPKILTFPPFSWNTTLSFLEVCGSVEPTWGAPPNMARFRQWTVIRGDVCSFLCSSPLINFLFSIYCFWD